ncbi:MAG: STELLO glycosyltransferase family protein [Planctomycetota bacterium]
MAIEWACVVTTIQEPTGCMQRLGPRVAAAGGRLIVIGDKKGPASFDLDGSDFFDLAEQQRLDFHLARSLPTGHYARKNLGYLLAMRAGARCIYETDDDNEPAAGWARRTETTHARRFDGHAWMNTYRALSGELLWPRGFPLRHLHDPATWQDADETTLEVRSSVQQGMADGSPDVDAVWRLVLDRDVRFPDGPSRWVPPGHWHPFNSQSTWWWPLAYPLMYLPTTCAFRSTDIWRSFVAQRCLREVDQGVVHHPPEVVQLRNEHDLMRDFVDEVEVQTKSEALVALLEGLALEPGIEALEANMERCYEALCAEGLLAGEELPRVRDWLADGRRLWRRGA